MGPKKHTKSTKSAKSTKDDKTVDPWVEELIGKTINDDNWKCNVTIMFESNPSITFYSSLLAAFCADKTNIFRRNMKILSYSDFKQSIIFDQAVENADPSKVKPYNKLCTHINSIMSVNSFDRNQFTPLLASFIKYKILEFKEESIQQSQLMEEYKRREKLDEEENKSKFEEILAKSNTTDSQLKTKKKSAPKKNTGKDKRKNGAKKGVRKLTTLKREQEFLHKVFIEDEPADGPKIYVVLTGFLEPNLPLELLALGVPLVGVLKLKTASFASDSSDNNYDDHTKIIEGLKLDEKLFDSSSKHDTHEKDDNRFQNFWRDFYVLLINYKNDDRFENVIFYPFSVILCREHYTNTDITNIISNISKKVYDNISQVQYNINRIINERLDYLGNLNIKEVYETKNSIDMSEYDKLLNSIPPDCVNVFHILEAILLQVTKTTTLEKQASENDDYGRVDSSIQSFSSDKDVYVNEDISTGVGDDLFSGIGSHISRLEEMYDLTCSVEQFDTLETQTLGKIDPQGVVFYCEDELEIKMYLHRKVRSTSKDDAIKLLEHFCRKRLGVDCSENNNLDFHESASNESNHLRTITSDEISSVLHIQSGKASTFNNQLSSKRSSNKFRANLEVNNNYILDENVFKKLCLIPCGYKNSLIEDKTINFCFDAPNLYEKNSECKNCPINQSENNDTNSEFCYSEICSESMVQNLFESVGYYECFDFETDDEGYHFVKFHTICCHPEKTLAGSLRTAICLRDFFYFIHSEITSETDLELESSVENTTLGNENNFHNKGVDNWCVDKDFIDADSLKRPKSMRFNEGHFQTPAESTSEQVFETDIKTQHDNNRALLDAFELSSSKIFNFTEKIKQFRFSKTFTARIRILCNPFNNDFVAIEPSIDDNTVYFYVGLRQKVNDIKFHIRHKSGMIIYFERTIPNRESIKGDTGFLNDQPGIDKGDVNTKSGSTSEESEDTKTYCKQLSYRFSLSWPSCMHLEFFNGSNKCPAYIKQWYSTSNKQPELNEDMRCYTQNGEILKFMKDESVIVYYPNGRIYSHMSTELSKSFRNSKILDESVQMINENKLSQSDYPNENVETSNLKQNNYKYEQTFQDFTNGTTRSELSNGVVLTNTYNGDLVVDFPDGSRITSTLDCEVEVTVIGDMIYEKYASTDENQFSNDSEQFVLISTHYLIEHECFATVSFGNFEKSTMKVGLPYNLSIFIESKNDKFVVNFNDESRMEIEKSEINIFNGNSIQSAILLSNIEEYSRTFPQFERYEFFNCKVDLKSVLSLDSWGEISTDEQHFCDTYSRELDNMYYIVKNDLSGYKIYPSDFETKLNQLTGKQCVTNVCVSSEYKTALFIQPLETCEWKMKSELFYLHKRSQSTVDCCRFFWLNPIAGEEKKSIIIETPLLLTIGLIQWFKSEQNFGSKLFRNKNIFNSILKNNDYRAAMDIYEKGNQIFFSDRLQVIDHANRIVSDTLYRVQSLFSKKERLMRIDRFKKLLRHDILCKYFNTKVGIGFSIADEAVTDALKSVEPKETAKLISSSIAEELINNVIGKIDLQAFKNSIETCTSKTIIN